MATREGRPDAQTNLGPATRAGGDETPGGPVPPYEGRRVRGPGATHEYMSKVMSGRGGSFEPGREVSDVEAAGVPATDTTAASPLGVGVSMSAQGNERALGDSEEKRRKDREEAGVQPGQPIDPAMPNLRPGDQGG